MSEIGKDWWDIAKLPYPPAAIEAGDLQVALNGFATREMLDYRLHGRCHSDVWVCGFGVVLWLMGDTDGAARVWSRACDEALRGIERQVQVFEHWHISVRTFALVRIRMVER